MSYYVTHGTAGHTTAQHGTPCHTTSHHGTVFHGGRAHYWVDPILSRQVYRSYEPTEVKGEDPTKPNAPRVDQKGQCTASLDHLPNPYA
jgi:hypothetical protein